MTRDISKIHAMWGTRALRGLWEQARKALETPSAPDTFRLELPDEETREAVGAVYGRPMWGLGTRINVSKLDASVRASEFGISLRETLEILHGRPVRGSTDADASETDHAPDKQADRQAEALRAALTERGLANAPWVRPWIEWVLRYGRIAAAETDTIAEHAANVLARLVLDPEQAVAFWSSRSEIAHRFAGDPHRLNDGTALTRVVLRAVALAHAVDAPTNGRERRVLWQRCGVTPDAVSATVLCWSLPLSGSDAWSEAARQRTALGLPTQLTHADLRAAPDQLVTPGSSIAVCENPRVLEAAIEQGITHPLVCLSENPSTTTIQLLNRLTASGATLRCHADFDWSGIAVARAIWANHGASMWRMSAVDYRESLNMASAQRVDLPTLVGEAVKTPWDPELAELMATAGRAVEEEALLPSLLDDLRSTN